MTAPMLTSAKAVHDKTLTDPPVVFVIMILFYITYVQLMMKAGKIKSGCPIAMPEFCQSFSVYFQSSLKFLF